MSPMPTGFATALRLASPGGRRGKLSILIYHRVLAEPDPLRRGDPDVKAFRWQMQLLARHFNVLPLRDAALRLRAGNLPARAACVTFDDGYADNFTRALPVLKELGIPATFFVATAYLDGGCMFNDILIEIARKAPRGNCDLSSIGLGEHVVSTIADRRSLVAKLIAHFKYQNPAMRAPAAGELAAQIGIAVPQDLMMTSAQLGALRAAGMHIGAHTHTHPILARQKSREAEQDIREGKHRLEALLGEPVGMFAYPNGQPRSDYGDVHVAIVKASGFDIAVSTRPAPADRSSDILQLPRFTPWDQTPTRFGLRLLRRLVFHRPMRE